MGWSAVPRNLSTDAGRKPLGPRKAVTDGDVVGLGAICELVQPVQSESSQATFTISEFVEMESGRWIVLHNDRGLAVGGNVVTDRFRTDELSELILGALLPDEEDEDSGEPHPWHRLAERAEAQGVHVSAAQLRSLPYQIHFGPGAQTLLDDR